MNHDEANRDGTLDTRQEIVGLAAETSTNGLESEMCTWRIEHSRVDSPSLEADAFFPNFTQTHDRDLEITQTSRTHFHTNYLEFSCRLAILVVFNNRTGPHNLAAPTGSCYILVINI